MQQLHDLWLYRTLPSLSIMGKIHNHLADEDFARREALTSDGDAVAPDRRFGFLRLSNESLECLNGKLGSLEDWRAGGPLPDEWKQSIGRQLRACEGEADMQQLLGRLPILTSDLSCLEAPSPAVHSAHSSFTAASSGDPVPSASSAGASRALSPASTAPSKASPGVPAADVRRPSPAADARRPSFKATTPQTEPVSLEPLFCEDPG